MQICYDKCHNVGITSSYNIYIIYSKIHFSIISFIWLIWLVYTSMSKNKKIIRWSSNVGYSQTIYSTVVINFLPITIFMLFKL